jgi:hypothetical protein
MKKKSKQITQDISQLVEKYNSLEGFKFKHDLMKENTDKQQLHVYCRASPTPEDETRHDYLMVVGSSIDTLIGFSAGKEGNLSSISKAYEMLQGCEPYKDKQIIINSILYLAAILPPTIYSVYTWFHPELFTTSTPALVIGWVAAANIESWSGRIKNRSLAQCATDVRKYLALQEDGTILKGYDALKKYGIMPEQEEKEFLGDIPTIIALSK